MMADHPITSAADKAREEARTRTGKFGTQPHAESELVSVDPASTAEILAADTNTLWGYVESGDPDLQIPASWSPAFTVDQAVVLAGPEQPPNTRLAMAGSVFGEAHDVLVDDPNPVVRFKVLRDSTQIDPTDRDRLRQDPQVQAVHAAFSAGSAA